MSFKESKLFALIKELSFYEFSKYGKICDEENRFPCENFELIKKHKLQAIMVPKEYGGFGLNFLEYQQALTEISKGCSATASAFNMHNIVVGGAASINLEHLDERSKSKIINFLIKIYHMTVEEKKIFAAATTEQGIGSRFSLVKTNYQKIDDKYIINGSKSFVTMATYADYYMVLANKCTDHDKLSDSSLLSYFLIPRHAKGVSIKKNWNVLGMRGTDSHEVIFKDVTLERSDLFMGAEGFALSKVIREPHWITGGYLGVYLGIMEAAFEFSCYYIKEKTNSKNQSGLGYQPLIQARVSEMYTLLNHARLVLNDAAQKVVTSQGSEETNNAIFNAKYVIGESAIQLTSLAIKTCGGSAIFKEYDLERHFRDSRCGALMPTVSDACQLYLGRHLLGIKENFIW